MAYMVNCTGHHYARSLLRCVCIYAFQHYLTLFLSKFHPGLNVKLEVAAPPAR